MPKSKSRNQNHDRGDLSHSKVVKGAAYGRVRSSDFAVSGHSTGATTTEMEALSHQVSRDAGEVPAYETDGYRSQTYRDRFATAFNSELDEEIGDFDSEFGAGPLLYGDNPPFLRDISTTSGSSSALTSSALKVWLPLGLVAGAIATYAGYRAYQNYKFRPIFPNS